MAFGDAIGDFRKGDEFVYSKAYHHDGARADAAYALPGFAEASAIDESGVRALLEELLRGRLTEDDVVARLAEAPYEDLGFARVDHHRALRKGFPEVVFGQGKTPDQIARLAAALLARSDRLLVTKAGPLAYEAVRERVRDARFEEQARAIVVDRSAPRARVGGVVVASAGTSDLPVAREAVVTAELMGCEVTEFNDVGVAGIHRLLEHLPALRAARVVVAVAGMEGALPSVVGGVTPAPVIAVPTSVGYGASFGGAAALLAMLNSCAPGVAVVNIDNGFGAGYLAAVIAKQAEP